MSNEEKLVEKDFYKRHLLTMSDQDKKNFEKLKEILPSKTKSGMFRYLLNFAVNNPNVFTTLNLPDSKSDKSVQELLQLRKELTLKEQAKTEKRFLDLETQNKEIINLVKQIHRVLTAKYPEESKAIKKDGLGGKV